MAGDGFWQCQHGAPCLVPCPGCPERESAVVASSRLVCTGVGRDREHAECAVVYFNRALTDDELRFFHDVSKRTASLMMGMAPATQEPVMPDPIPFRRPASASMPGTPPPVPDIQAGFDVMRERFRLLAGGGPPMDGADVRTMLVYMAARTILCIEACDQEQASGGAA